MNTNGTTVKYEAQQALNKLSNTSVKTLTDHDLQEWAVLGERLGFSTALPERPSLPPTPEEPVLTTPPREDDPKYDVQLSTLDKLLSSRRIKKQDAALKRFEKDRKAWNEDRDYARGIYEQATKKHQAELKTLEAAYEAALDQWKRDFEAHLGSLVQRAA
jgi:hypothetical protein